MDCDRFHGATAHTSQGGATPPFLDSSWMAERINASMDQVDRRLCRIHQERASQSMFDLTELGSARSVSPFS